MSVNSGYQKQGSTWHRVLHCRNGISFLDSVRYDLSLACGDLRQP
jgi:hypothetical protein